MITENKTHLVAKKQNRDKIIFPSFPSDFMKIYLYLKLPQLLIFYKAKITLKN